MPRRTGYRRWYRVAVRFGAPQIGEQQRHRFGCHGGTSIRMQGQLSPPDLLLLTGVFDESLGQHRRLRWGNHPADHVPAEDVQNDIEVAVRPLHGAQEF